MSLPGIILPSTMTKAKSLGKIAVRSSALFLCDMQEKFRTTISYFPEVIQVAQRMLKTADILDVPVVVTEQYPKGFPFSFIVYQGQPYRPSEKETCFSSRPRSFVSCIFSIIYFVFLFVKKSC